MVDLLDILPPEDVAEKVAVITRNKKKIEVDVRPLNIAELKKITMRYPDLRKSLFKDAPEDIRGVAMMEAMPAMIAAAHNKLGNADYEKHIEKIFSQPQIMKLGGAILALTYPREEEEDSPLPTAGDLADEALAEAANETTLPQQ